MPDVTKMRPREYIKIRGANEHNLKSLDVDIPRNELVVLTGLSGSGKSSLAFDTIYAEGQRRYMESLSSYARQFLGQMEKPNAEKIVRHFGFGAYTDVIYGADHENKLKKADIIRLCLESTGVCDRKTAVMIGDSDNDAIGAQRLDLDFLGVTYGFGFKNKEEILRFPNAVGTACRAEELLDFFDNKGDCLK